MKPTVLIIDDEEKLRGLLRRIISLEGYAVKDVAGIGAARELLQRHSVDIVLCDVKLKDGNGVEYTKELKSLYPHLEIILLTAFGNIPDGVQAIKNGAYDYLVKGDDNEKIIPLLSRLSEKISDQREIKRIGQQAAGSDRFHTIIGKSDALNKAKKLAEKVAATDTAVLLTGETGTGKEVFAQAIHEHSLRSKKSFIAINCSAFSKDLLESELFGHKSGAFTGATKDKKGLIEEATGGTLFLDEIGELPIDLQPKLLRLLENGTYIRVGDTREQQADIRLIAATNRDLQLEVAQKHFRDDLYYRIAVFNIELPPLRERLADIPLLAAHYLQVFTAKAHKHVSSISSEALQLLCKNAWQGNVRELKNVIERAVILEDSDVLTLSSLPINIQVAPDAANPFQLSEVERVHIQKVLLHTGGNKAETARLLNIGLATLYRKIDDYGLR